ncbi:hypothetical protein PRZ48_002219 [Zasmidium cellare]|uniref:Uncharacterized protein n=1 Tax=Zasmidium cellare TaxID=395010 RepID=A0ABR0F553_ZASCE|nr:hypothetical protein PRZ48_002219 [Zasmidium cellare]
MPRLDEITYSRQVCIDAVRDYYKFLIQVHLPEDCIDEPPEGGWPHITPENTPLGKTDEVVALLRHMPYLRYDHGAQFVEGAPLTTLVDWHYRLQVSMRTPRGEGEIDEGLRLVTEGLLFLEAPSSIPAHVMGLATGGRDCERFLLDTHLGIIYWLDCPSQVAGHAPWEAYPEGVLDSAWDYAETEEEALWRDCPAWSVPDFFEMLKDQFRKVNIFPTGTGEVRDVWSLKAEKVDKIPETFREHGWPDLEKYRKQECLDAIQVVYWR